jgi:hypothetical protein
MGPVRSYPRQVLYTLLQAKRPFRYCPNQSSLDGELQVQSSKQTANADHQYPEVLPIIRKEIKWRYEYLPFLYVAQLSERGPITDLQQLAHVGLALERQPDERMACMG